jgi:hypothetical protein
MRSSRKWSSWRGRIIPASMAGWAALSLLGLTVCGGPGPHRGSHYVKAATAVAGAVGTLIVFGVAWGLAGVFSRRSARTPGLAVADDAGS